MSTVRVLMGAKLPLCLHFAVLLASVGTGTLIVAAARPGTFDALLGVPLIGWPTLCLSLPFFAASDPGPGMPPARQAAWISVFLAGIPLALAAFLAVANYVP